MRVAATGGAVKEIAVRMVKLATSAQISQPDVRCRVFVNIFLLPPKKKGLRPRGVRLLLWVSIEDHTKTGFD